MEEADVDFGDGDYGEEEQNDVSPFNRNEAISAVTDEGFMVEEEEDDYEDLYNDVNVSENFLQSVHQNQQQQHVHQEELGFNNNGVQEEKKIKVERVEEEEPEEKNVNDKLKIKLEPSSYDDSGLGFTKSETWAGAVKTAPPPGLESDVKPVIKDAESTRMEFDDMARMAEPIEPVRNNIHNNNNNVIMQQNQHVVNNEGHARPGSNGGYSGGCNNGGGGGGGTMLFVGDLHWWTTDAELEAELCKYGNVREIKFHDEKASGKSKGYCQVEFYDPAAAAACKEGMNGHLFNGKPCVVQHASSFSIRKMGDAQVNKAQAAAAAQSNMSVPPPRRGMSEGGGRGGGSNMSMGGGYQGGNYQENNGGGRGYGRSNYGRGNGMGRGGQGPIRGRGGMGGGGRGMMGNGFGPNPQMMHPQAMMGQGFDPSYGPRMAGYGGFSAAPAPQFPGMMSPFPPVGGIGMPGVAPHVNPAFFGRGMPANGMGMMPATGMEGGMGMWHDPASNGWGGEDPSGRVAESSYGEDATSEHQYGDGALERGRPSAMKEKDRPSEREWSGASNRKYRDDRDPESERDVTREKDVHDYEWSERRPHEDRAVSRDREKPRERDRDRDRERDRYREDKDRDKDRYREDRDRHADHHRYKERAPEYDDMAHYKYKDYGPEYEEEWDRGRSSRAYSKSRLPHEDSYRSRSRDAEYSKRRRLPSE